MILFYILHARDKPYNQAVPQTPTAAWKLLKYANKLQDLKEELSKSISVSFSEIHSSLHIYLRGVSAHLSNPNMSHSSGERKNERNVTKQLL